MHWLTWEDTVWGRWFLGRSRKSHTIICVLRVALPAWPKVMGLEWDISTRKAPLQGLSSRTGVYLFVFYRVPSCWRGRIRDQDFLEESVAFSSWFLSLQSYPSKQAFSFDPSLWEGSNEFRSSLTEDNFRRKRLVHSWFWPSIQNERFAFPCFSRNKLGHQLRPPGWISSVLSAPQHPWVRGNPTKMIFHLGEIPMHLALFL